MDNKIEEAEVRPEGFPVDYKVVLVVKAIRNHKVYAEIWGSKARGDLSRLNVDVFDSREKYGSIAIPEEAFDCIVHHVCFDDVDIPTIRGASAPLAAIFRSIRKRFSGLK
jgi:hypothetical protein